MEKRVEPLVIASMMCQGCCSELKQAFSIITPRTASSGEARTGPSTWTDIYSRFKPSALRALRPSSLTLTSPKLWVNAACETVPSILRSATNAIAPTSNGIAETPVAPQFLKADILDDRANAMYSRDFAAYADGYCEV